MNALRAKQVAWVIVAIACLAAAGSLQRPLGDLGREHDLFVEAAGQADMPMVRVMPGGLRALAFNYIWLRSQQQHQEGRHYDAKQLASMACRLMPSFPGAWSFHAWNLAWNVSVTTHTREERWHWVHEGMTLLRDEGIPHNRQALLLYKEMGWIFFFKMGESLDEMHDYYKQQWAYQMQQLLGAPGFGETQDVIDAFRPIAEAPLDKALSRQGQWTIQPEQHGALLQDPAVAEYAELLADYDVHIDSTLLAAYNRFSLDMAVASVRVMPPKLTERADRDLSELINDSAHADARNRMLAFVRAQTLWNTYKMDPQWMLQLMEKYDAPFDWRMVWPHGLYWITYGLHVCEAAGLDDITTINTDRIAMFCLRSLVWGGRMTYRENPRDPDAPMLSFLADYRYIQPTHNEYITSIQEMIDAAKARGEDGGTFNDSKFRSGHESFLKTVIPMLYAGYYRQDARDLYDWLRKTYTPAGPEWLMSLDDYVVFRLNEPGMLIPDIANSQIYASLAAALQHLAAGNRQGFADSYNYALNKVYATYQQRADEPIRLRPFKYIVDDITAQMLIRPQALGADMDLTDRAGLYESIEGISSGTQERIYRTIAPSLKIECEQHGYDFDKAFPSPLPVQQNQPQFNRPAQQRQQMQIQTR